MSHFLIGCGVLALCAVSYAVGWTERGEHDRAMRNIDRLADLATENDAHG